MNKISPGIFNVLFSTPNLSTRMLMLHLQFVFAVLSLLVMCGQFYFVVTHPTHCTCLCLITMSSTGQPVPRSLDSSVSSLLLGSWDLNRTTTVTVWDNVSTSCLWLIKLNLSTHDQTPPELGSAGQHGASQIWFFVGNFVSAPECVTWCFPADFYVVPKRPWNYHRYGTFPFLDAHFFQFDSKLWHFSHFPTPRPQSRYEWCVVSVRKDHVHPRPLGVSPSQAMKSSCISHYIASHSSSPMSRCLPISIQFRTRTDKFGF